MRAKIYKATGEINSAQLGTPPYSVWRPDQVELPQSFDERYGVVVEFDDGSECLLMRGEGAKWTATWRRNVRAEVPDA